jgi:hypothetical protein
MRNHVADTTMKRHPVLWWAGPLLVALALIGHDALMATDAHAASPAASTQTRLTSHEAANQGAGHSADWFNSEHQPDHADACDVARPIAQPEPSGFVSIVQIDTITLVGVIEASNALEPRPPWADPTAPPSVRRALLQVFLI